jgi:glucokinase
VFGKILGWGSAVLDRSDIAGHADQHVLIDIDGATANFAIGLPGTGLVPGTVRSYKTADFPTATDCIQGFAKEMGLKLSDMRCAVAVSGAISGDSIRIARCPWIISATGFGYLFQRPVYFLNDSAAMLWGATRVGATTHRTLGPYNMPDFSKAGKWLGINYNTGLGAALLIGEQDGSKVHVETEAGHCAYSHIGPVETILADNLARSKSPVSWERAMFASQDDPVWGNTPVAGNQSALLKQRAEILGSFVGDTILATGAWNGVFMFGASVALLNNPDHLLLFSKRLETRANFQLQLRNVPRWSVSMPNLNLVGASCYLDQRIKAL